MPEHEYDLDSYELSKRPERPCAACGKYDREARAIVDDGAGHTTMVHVGGCLPEFVVLEGHIATVAAAAEGLTGTERAEAVLAAARENTES